MTNHLFFAKSPLQIERLLADELREFGAEKVSRTVAGVHFQGPLEVGYRALLWTRLANTILVRIGDFEAATDDALYDGIRDIDWREHMGVDDTLKVTFTSRDSEVYHNRYGAQRVKDAVTDQFRDRTGSRPSVELDEPDIHINCHIEENRALVSIDLAGSSLHRRSYRPDSGTAPLKENVAAAVLLRAGWPEIGAEGRPLYDPMCGSGTLLIEGALMIADHAPALLRDYLALVHWRGHDEVLWERLVDEAKERAETGRRRIPVIAGSDLNANVLKTARKNTEGAGLAEFIDFERRAVREIEPPAGDSWPGLVVTNAPYGERLGSEEEAKKLHRRLGESLKERFGGWHASILTGSKELAWSTGLRADKMYLLFNGPMKCRLLNAEIYR